MDAEAEKSQLQILRESLSKSCPVLPDYKIIEMCEHYGIQYDMPDTNTYRLFTILASAENQLMKLREE